MRKTKRFTTLILVVVLSLTMGMTAFAANKKESILSAMTEAATELGVQNSSTFKNAYDSVAAYEGTITDEQYNAALAEIQTIKDAIAKEGVEAVRADKNLQNELIAHVIKAGEAVGVTITYQGEGAGKVTAGASKPQVSNPIKQTGADFTMTFIMLAVVAAAFGGCVAAARKRRLFA